MKCHLTQDPPPYCRRRPALLCITERLIHVARGASADRAVELLLVAAARLCLRGERPCSALINGAARAIVRARGLEERLEEAG
jgi:hypothetical protein